MFDHMEEKAKTKRENMDQVNSWKKNANQNDHLLDGKKAAKKLGKGFDDEGAKKVKKGISKSAAKDAKWGFGGKKKGSKQNTKESAADMSAYNPKVHSNARGGG